MPSRMEMIEKPCDVACVVKSLMVHAFEGQTAPSKRPLHATGPLLVVGGILGLDVDSLLQDGGDLQIVATQSRIN